MLAYHARRSPGFNPQHFVNWAWWCTLVTQRSEGGSSSKSPSTPQESLSQNKQTNSSCEPRPSSSTTSPWTLGTGTRPLWVIQSSPGTSFRAWSPAPSPLSLLQQGQRNCSRFHCGFTQAQKCRPSSLHSAYQLPLCTCPGSSGVLATNSLPTPSTDETEPQGEW